MLSISIKASINFSIFLLVLALHTQAQNTLTGTITSVPANTVPAQVRVTFTNTANANKYSQLTTTGSFSITVPTGTYQRKVEAPGNYLVVDTLLINSTRTINEKVIDHEPLTSTVYGPSGFNWSLLQLLEVLSVTDDNSPQPFLFHATNYNPWRLYARNYNASDPESMPADLRDDLDYALAEIESKIPEINFNEVFTQDLTNGITFVYPTTANMPAPAVGFTQADDNNAIIYIDRDKVNNNSRERKTFLREMFRGTLIGTYSIDPDFITYYEDTLIETIHPDEANVLSRYLTIPQGTDMRKHRDVLVTTVPNTIFSSISITGPPNNSTVSYDGSGNFQLLHNRTGQRDDDGDPLTQTWKIFQNNVLVRTYTLPHNSAVTVNKTDFTEGTTYTATVTLTDGFLQVTSPFSTFTTPAPAAQTITFAPLAAKTFGDAPFALTATASSGLAVSYTSSNPAVATVSGNTVTIVGAGTTTITASQNGDTNWAAATPVQQTLTVNKANQTITFNALAAKSFGDAPFNLIGSASSGLAVSYTSSNTAVATVSGNTVTIVGTGTTTITASQAGNANYNAATSVQQTLTVNKANQTITFNALAAKTFGDAPFSLTATSSSGLAVSYTSSNTAVATTSGSTVTIVGAGTTTITASQPGDANYNAATPVQQTLTVNKASQTITFNALPVKTFGDAPFGLTATSSSGLTVTYTSSNTAVATVSGSTVTIVGAGTTTITASQPGNSNYNAATPVQQTLTVNKASQTITFNALPAKTVGDAPFGLTATSSSGLAVTYISSNTAVATISGSTVTIVGAGTTTITASQPGDANYNAATPVQQTLTVNKASQTITFNALAAKTFGDAPFNLTGSASSGLTVSYTSSNTAVATISGSTVTIVGAGTTTITASQPGDGNYNAATPVQQTLTVSKSNQTITFNPLPAKTVGDAPFGLTATSSSGLVVTYTSSNTAVATISGSMVTIAGVATTTITASQAGNDNYNAATPVQQTLTVNKANQIITFNTLAAKTFGDAPFNLTGSASSGLTVSYTSSNTAVATVSGSTVTIVGAGTTTITASQPGDANYNAATPVQQTLTVNKASQTITFNTLPAKTVGDAPFGLTATASSGLAVTYISSNTAVATISGSTVTIMGAGTTTITASQSGDANYNAATSVQQTLTVNKASQTITFNALPAKTVGDAPFGLTATASSGLAVTYISSNTAVATISGSTVTIVGAGTTTITASQIGDANYNAATPVQQTLTVNSGTVVKQDQTITFNALPGKSYGDPPFALTATATSGLSVTYTSSNTSVATISGNTVTIAGVGTTTITAAQSGDANYNAAPPVQQTLTVNKAGQTITFGPLVVKTFGDAPFNLTATASSGLAVTYTSSNTAVATVSGSTVTIVGAGTATITASQPGDANYNAATPVQQTLTVNKANQTIAFSALAAKTFGDAPFNLTATASSGLAVTYTSSNMAVATVSGSTVTIVGAGTTTITASQPGNTNYNAATPGQQTLTVNKANQTITFSTLAAKTFGDAPFNLTATASSGLTITYTSSNTTVATVSGSTVTIVGAGTTTITASQSGDGNYNAATPVQQTLTVNKANQTITFNALAAKTFGDAPFNLTGSASSGLVVSYTSSNPAVATVSGNSVTIIGAGTTTITASQSGDTNYAAATPVQQTLTVNKAAQTITFNTLAAKTFGDASFNLTGSASSGLVITYTSSNQAIATVSGSTVTIIGAGTTTITATQSGNTNYNAATPVQQTLTVNKAAQTITFNALAAKTFGDASFNLTGSASSGLVVSYTSSNPAVATVSGSTVTIVGAGTTAITATQSGNTNYNAATPVQQTLTVNKASQAISFTTLPAKTVGDPPFALTATASSGLTVSYTSSNNAVATVSGSTVTIVGAGTTVITASQGGNGNYFAATPVQQTLTVNAAPVVKQNQTITFNSLPAKTYGDPPFALTATASSGLAVYYTSSNNAVATVSGNLVTIAGVGTTILTATQSGDANYNAAPPVQQTLTVNKAGQTITFNPLPAKTFGDTPFNLTATASSGLTVSYSSSNPAVATVSGTTVTIVGAGSTTITATQGGNTNYNAATPVQQTLTVNKASQTITFNPLPAKTFGDTPFSLAATASSGLTVSYSSSNPAVATVSGNTVTIVGAGTSTITATQSGNTNFNAATAVQQTLTVNKAGQTITFNAIPVKTVGDPPFGLTATTTSGLTISYTSSNNAVATVSGSTVTIIGAGTTTITASQSGNDNYTAAAPVQQTLTVNTGTVVKLNQTISFSTLPVKTYGDSPFALTATASSGLEVSYTSSNPGVASVSGHTVTITGAGTTIITAMQGGNNNYNAATPVQQTLTINKATQTITFNPLPAKNYGDAPFSLTATASSGLAVTYSSSNPAIATISGNTVTIVGAGTVTITASQGGDGNYLPANNVDRTLVVNCIGPETPIFDLQPSPVCQGQNNVTYSVQAIAGATYVWDYSGSGAALTPSGHMVTINFNGTATSGTLSVKAINVCDESAPATISVVVNPATPKPVINADLTDPANPVLTSSASSGNQWFMNAASIAGATAQTYSPTASGEFTVQVTLSGCSSAFADAIPIVITGDIDSQREVQFYPNPVGDYIMITGINETTGISATDLMGRVIRLVPVRIGEDYYVDVSALTSGPYLLLLKEGNAARKVRFVKK